MHSTLFSSICAAIIDLDGTMLDTAPDFLVALNAMRAQFGLSDINLATVKLFVGKGTENLIERVLARDMSENETAKHFDAALASYQQHYQQINGQLSNFYLEVMIGLQAFKNVTRISNWRFLQ
jgi:phosphoglycolate phosphatase